MVEALLVLLGGDEVVFGVVEAHHLHVGALLKGVELTPQRLDVRLQLVLALLDLGSILGSSTLLLFKLGRHSGALALEALHLLFNAPDR